MCIIIYVMYDPMYDSPDSDGQKDVLAIERTVELYGFSNSNKCTCSKYVPSDVTFSSPGMILSSHDPICPNLLAALQVCVCVGHRVS